METIPGADLEPDLVAEDSGGLEETKALLADYVDKWQQANTALKAACDLIMFLSR